MVGVVAAVLLIMMVMVKTKLVMVTMVKTMVKTKKKNSSTHVTEMPTYNYFHVRQVKRNF